MKKRQSVSSHIPLEQTRFRGLKDRGVTKDSTQIDYFTDCLNIDYAENEFSTRDGSILYLTKANIVRFWSYKRLNETPRVIFLDSAGNLYDSLAVGSPIYTDATFTDFSLLNYNNRAYITAHNRLKGIAGKSLLVYEGTGLARLAAGQPPSGFSITAVEPGASGFVEAGIHLIAVVNVTSSGFITAPGPTIFTEFTASGDKQINLSTIAVGGSAVIARIILITKSIPASLYSGNQFGYEFFFLPGGTINDNVTTVLNGISFFDADLVDSADYLFDNIATIPAGLGLCIYNKRLVIWAESGNEFTIRASEPGQPEVFSSLDGFLTIDPTDAGSGIRNCFEYRKNLVIATSNRIHSTADNGSGPLTWQVEAVDKSSGTECFGVANVLDARGNNSDRVWIASYSGLVSFEGYVKRPELSWNIEAIWKRINKIKFNLVQVVDDPTNHRFFISVPLDAATVISHILLGDYSEAFTVYGTIDEKAIKWAIWSFPTAPVSIVGDIDSVTGTPILKVALTAGNIYDVKEGLFNDFGNAIEWYAKTDYKTALDNWINHFGGIKLRVKGTGNLQVSMFGEDDTVTATAPSIIMAQNPGYEPDRITNFQNEKMALKLRANLFEERATISKITIYAKPIWLRRPA